MSKPKYPVELKLETVKAYESGEGSYQTLAKKYGIGHKSVEDWGRKYRAQGECGLLPRSNGNSSYSSEFKMKCVEAVNRGDGSVDDIVAKYNISDRGVLRDWIARYNANKELKDYDPKREVYIEKQHRKSEKKLRHTVLRTIRTIRVLLYSTMFHTTRFTHG